MIFSLIWLLFTKAIFAQVTTFIFDTVSSNIPYQNFVVPCTVSSITIEAQGASGGNMPWSNGTIIQGGKPALIKGTFNVTPGDTIKFRAAKPGLNGFLNTSSNNAFLGGGGGGSWAINSNSGQVLAVAGGGGAASVRTFPSTQLQNGGPATVTNNGTSGGITPSTATGGGGGGWLTDGFSPIGTSYGGKSYSNGGAGGSGNGGGGIGGGGGGGNGGGGGGYSGGIGSYNIGSSLFASQGGGSYNSGTNQVNSILSSNATVNSGFIKITYDSPVPSITSFSPISGPIGTSVTLVGENFNSIPSNNIVFFGATMATVISSTADSLTVIVPNGATYQNISVTDNISGYTGYSSQPFNVTFDCGNTINSTSFSPKVDFTVGTNPQFIVSCDFDKDGKPDIASANSGTSNISVLRNTGFNGLISFAPKVDFVAGTQPVSMTIGDFNGDGREDIAIARYNPSFLSILINTSNPGSISFAPVVNLTNAGNPKAITSGDFDGDGMIDLAVANTVAGSVSILRNNTIKCIGTLSFVTLINITTGISPEGITAGDFDGDGKIDLAVANTGSATFSLLKNTSNNGTISFAPKVDYITGNGPVGIAWGDIDGDNKLEIVTANYSANKISVFRNISIPGTITFSPKVDFITGTQPNSVSIMDLNGDNKLDIAVVNFVTNSLISVFRNLSSSGTISLAPKVDFTTGTQSKNVSLTDFDGDGKPDLASCSLNSGTVSVLRNLISGVIPNVTSNSSSTSICAGSSVILTGGGAEAYSWSGGVQNGIAFVPPVGTTSYTVTGTINSSGCSNTATISITSGPDININSSATSLCDGQSIILTASGADSYLWNNGAADGVSFNPSIGTTTYTVIGTNTSTGCQNTDSIQITVNPLPNVNAGNDQTTCNGQSVTLNASGATTYSWNNSVTNNSVFTPTATNTYIVVGTDANGCQDSDTVNVTVHQNTSSTITQTADNTYILNGQTYTQSGSYTQVIPNTNGCDSTITLNLTINNIGLDEVSNSAISIYPNPASNQITIAYAGQIQKVEILDAKGATVYSSIEHKKEIVLPSNMQSGYYLLLVHTAEGIYRKELVVNK